MAQLTEYITIHGDRWDTIATKAYGDAFLQGLIIRANPTIAIDAIFEGGIRISIPVLDGNEQNIDINLLPPWKR